MSAANFCPHCGTARPADAGFCPGCGRPFAEAAAPVGVAPLANAPAPADPGVAMDGRPPGRTVSPFLMGLFVVLVIGGGFLITFGVIRNPFSGGISAADVPPAGDIWFGTSFDPTTFEIAGKTSSVAVNEPFSIVAHTTRRTNMNELLIRNYWDGTLYLTQPITSSGEGDVFGFTPGAIALPGSWKYELVDIGGSVLASGTVQAS